MINKLLVANRGEIARRIFRTCRELGIGTVAVYSEADAEAPFVREADVAVPLPGNTPGETYLRAELVVAAARSAGADAVHPGYGFLSENAAFARAVLDAGLIWVGPAPAAIETMGSKIESKRLMAEAGVPVLPELTVAEVTETDLPVLVKASAGGGGRGMRVVRTVAELPDAVASASAEAGSAFGDATVFCERYLETGRHIEVQVLADGRGGVWALGERECSIQRRHQKVVEEAPSPLVTPELRRRLCDAAVAAARAVDYVGAGTVEFLAFYGEKPHTVEINGSEPSIVDSRQVEFYFLEMNTRLQVEHPVTELVTGLDLVALQLAVADGAPLPAAEPPALRGHAIEVRLYAEDPAHDWQPQSGRLHRFDIPGVTAEFTGAGAAPCGVRLDSGVETGSTVGVHYDPMLAKVISWAPTRTAAARALAGALARAAIHGLRTNRDLLVRILRHPEFLAGDIDTAFFDRHGLTGPDGLAAALAGEHAVRLSALAAALAAAEANRAAAAVQPRLPGGWRNVVSAPLCRRFTHGDDEIDIAYRVTRGRLDAPDFPDVTLVSAAPGHVVLAVAGVRHAFTVSSYAASPAGSISSGATGGPAASGSARSGGGGIGIGGLADGSAALVHIDSALGPVALTTVPRFTDPTAVLAAGSLVAPMPGTVLRVAFSVGDAVTAGQPVLWLEAMKMEHKIVAPADGVLAELAVTVGQQVDVGTVLAVVADDTAPPRPSTLSSSTLSSSTINDSTEDSPTRNASTSLSSTSSDWASPDPDRSTATTGSHPHS